MNKSIYKSVASIINATIKEYYGPNSGAKVSVIDHDDSSSKYAILLNDVAYDLAQGYGKLEDMLYTGEIFIVDGGDDDFYLEPINALAFQIAC